MMFSKSAMSSLCAAIVLSNPTGAFLPHPHLAGTSTKSCLKLQRPFPKNNALFMVATDSTKTKRRVIPKKKSVLSRSQAETVDLIRDIVQAVADAGPTAGPTRTLQAYSAFATTARDFSPFQPFGKKPEPFSAPKAIRKVFERMGATYIKLGQFIASSPTIFPSDYVLEFQKCLDQTDALEWSSMKNVIETELGPISNTFTYVNPKPLASASIAQVHEATLKNGDTVVIKIQKPGIDRSLKADLSFIYVASRVLEFLQPDWERTSLAAIAGDIRTSMLEELDFLKEARNIEEFRYFLKENDLSSGATAPKVYREFTTARVLTMEKLDGVSLLDKDSIAAITSDPEGTIITALNVWTTSVTAMPWFHADVHAGNLLVLKDGRVGFIDFGIVGRVSEKTFEAVSELSTSLALADYEGMAQAMVNMGAADEEVDVANFGMDIEKVLKKMNTVQPDVTVTSYNDGSVGGAIGFDENEITQLLLDFVDVTENNGLKLPREFGLLVKQMLYFDRYLKILAPELDVMDDARLSGIGGAKPLPSVVDTDAIDV